MVVSRVTRNMSHFLLQTNKGSSNEGGDEISGRADVISVCVRLISCCRKERAAREYNDLRVTEVVASSFSWSVGIEEVEATVVSGDSAGARGDTVNDWDIAGCSGSYDQ
jgi:hypothetical protein